VTKPLGIVRVAAVGDLHCRATSAGAYVSLFTEMSAAADVVVLAGDLTDLGLPDEAAVLAHEISSCIRVPVVAVLGNHDFESNREADVTRTLTDIGVHVLDGQSVELHEVGFAGVKGFAGGFGERTLQPWGEPSIKHFVREAVEESLKLESALAKLRTLRRVVVVHYAPTRDTVVGEPLEIYPFLGSSRLEEPIARFGVDAVFHGHAHHGSLEGRVLGGIPVYNVAMPLLTRSYTGRPPFRVIELDVHPSAPEPAATVAYSVSDDLDR
jgi:Icc-related predicted phosphoesterase